MQQGCKDRFGQNLSNGSVICAPVKYIHSPGFSPDCIDCKSPQSNTSFEPFQSCSKHICSSGHLKKDAKFIEASIETTDDVCCDPLTCSSYVCSDEKQLRSNPESIKIPFALETDKLIEHLCCRKKRKKKVQKWHACSSYECPNGSKLKRFAELIVIPVETRLTSNLCCYKTEPICSFYDCKGKGYTRKKKASQIKGYPMNDERCCDPPKCIFYECNEKGRILKFEAQEIVGMDNETCCTDSCSLYTCKTGKLKELSEYIAGSSDAKCCDPPPDAPPTCDFYICKAEGFTLRSNASEIQGSSDIQCCIQPPPPPILMCNIHKCEKGKLKKNANQIRGESDLTCCDLPPGYVPKDMCSTYVCKSGTLKRNADLMQGKTDQACCDPPPDEPLKCSFHKCIGPGYKLKPNFEQLEGSNDVSCCNPPVCIDYECKRKGTILKLEAENIVGMDDETCCDVMCSIHTCKSGTLKENADAIAGRSDVKCCDPPVDAPLTCDFYTCEKGSVLQPHANRIEGNDEDTCCIQPPVMRCNTHICEKGTLKKGANGIIGDSDQMCCDLPPGYVPKDLCSTYVCTSGTLKGNAHLIEGKTDQVCCDPPPDEPLKCSFHKCITPGYILKTNADEREGMTDDICCEKLITCADYTSCSPGTVKMNALDIRGSTYAECCNPPKYLCKDFTGCETTSLRKDRLHEKGATKKYCCEAPQSCAEYHCSSGVLRLNAFSIKGSSDGVCCKEPEVQESCDKWTCPNGSTSIENAKNVIGSSDSACCIGPSLCNFFSCPTNYIPVDNSSETIGRTTDRCCVATCILFNCPEYWKRKPNAQNISGTEVSDCCLKQQNAPKLCSNYTCKNGVHISDAAKTHGNDEDTCCVIDEEINCNNHQCKCRSCRLKSNAVLIHANTDAACCDQMCNGYSCTSGRLRDDAENIIGARDSTCCEVLPPDTQCKEYVCSPGTKMKDGYENRTGSSDRECCDPLEGRPLTCNLHSCSFGYLKKMPHLIEGSSDQICCTKPKVVQEKESCKSQNGDDLILGQIIYVPGHGQMKIEKITIDDNKPPQMTISQADTRGITSEIDSFRTPCSAAGVPPLKRFPTPQNGDTYDSAHKKMEKLHLTKHTACSESRNIWRNLAFPMKRKRIPIDCPEDKLKPAKIIKNFVEKLAPIALPLEKVTPLPPAVLPVEYPRQKQVSYQIPFIRPFVRMTNPLDSFQNLQNLHVHIQGAQTDPVHATNYRVPHGSV
eukprot:g583.t1